MTDLENLNNQSLDYNNQIKLYKRENEEKMREIENLKIERQGLIGTN